MLYNIGSWFHVWPSDFLQSYLRSDMSRVHVIAVILCSELLIRLSYYIHQAYGKKCSTLAGIEPGTCQSWIVCLNRSARLSNWGEWESNLRPQSNNLRLLLFYIWSSKFSLYSRCDVFDIKRKIISRCDGFDIKREIISRCDGFVIRRVIITVFCISRTLILANYEVQNI